MLNLEEKFSKIKKNKKTLFVLVFLLFWLSLFLSQKINLVNIDLGRHIQNGHFFVEHFKVPSTNLYSYTFPNVPFINHHWGSGVIFYFIWKYVGFSGLTFLYIALSLLSFSLLFLFTKKFAGLAITTLSAVLVIPLIGERTEVRPEVFSYFLAIIFFVLLWRFKKGRSSWRPLLLLPLLELFWINLHIYFILGIGFLGIFLLDALVRKKFKKFKTLSLILLLTLGASLVNPFGIKGLIYPLNIFRNYGYRVLENQSVGFLDKIGFINNPNLFIFKIVLFFLFASFIFLLATNRAKWNWPLLGISLTVSILGWNALRNFGLFGYFAMPVIAYNLKYGLEKKFKIKDYWFGFFIFFLASSFFFFFSYLSRYKLLQGNESISFKKEESKDASAIFFKENGLSGPIFNNYDIGGFLIFHLFPQEKVFVDNRPEAYPDYFFKDIYIPMQESDESWNRLSLEYSFNVIFFSMNDATNWGQDFLVKRAKDAQWAPVFANQEAIIFLKRNEKNKELISKFEIPKDRFRITPP
jgi:hypothetical protein